PWLLVGVAASLAVLIVNMLVWKSRTGLSVTNFQGPRTSAVAAGLAALIAAALAASVVARFRLGYELAPLFIGAAAAVFAAVGSRLWDRAWLAETRVR
ncbi:MAG: hypothetical protein KY449_13865, partial [Proteobacteria bacterium]|nr:hypothetical protein [Pseudomonadota bacterium]